MCTHKIDLPTQVLFGTEIQKVPEPKAVVSYLVRFAVNVAPLILREVKRAVRLFGCLYAERSHTGTKFSLHLLALETK